MVMPGAATSPLTSDALLHVGRAARGRDVTMLAAEPRARAMLDILISQNRYAVLYRIDAAKRAGSSSRSSA
jgi:hypothetical protein